MKRSALFSVCLLITVTSFAQFVSVGVDTSVVLPVSQVRIGSFFISTDEPLYLDTCWMDVYAPPEHASILQDVRIKVDGEAYMSQMEIPNHWMFFPSILVNFDEIDGKRIDVIASISHTDAPFLELYLWCYLRPITIAPGMYTNDVVGHRTYFLNTGIMDIDHDSRSVRYDYVYDILGRVVCRSDCILESGVYVGIKNQKREKFFVP
jgi:hypothetical protein